MAPVVPSNDQVPSNHFMANHMTAPNQGSNGIIMVDTMKLQPSRLNTNATTNAESSETTNSNSKKNRKNQRNKNKTKETTQAPPQLVTLRNPMFQPNGIPAPPSNVTFTPTSLPPNIPLPPMNIDQPAAIIKNNNGMFTIRNPALHEAMIQQMPNPTASAPGYPVFPRHLPPPPIHNTTVPPPSNNNVPISRHQDNYSFFSDHHQPEVTTQSKPPTQAIGSEIKQRLQQTASWSHQQNSVPPPSAVGSSSVGGSDLFNHLNNLNHHQPFARAPPSPYSFNSDFVGATTNGISSSPVPSFYNNGGSGGVALGSNNNNINIDTNFSSFGSSSMSGSINNGAGMMNMGTATPPPPVNNSSFFYGNSTGANVATKNYDDSSYMYNLQPGQRLNNEVSVFIYSLCNIYRLIVLQTIILKRFTIVYLWSV